jgi:hypothetical protein
MTTISVSYLTLWNASLFRSGKHQILQLIITVYLPFHSVIPTNKHSTSGTQGGLVFLLKSAAGHNPEPYPITFDRHILFSLRPFCIAIRHPVPCFLKSGFSKRLFHQLSVCILYLNSVVQYLVWESGLNTILYAYTNLRS